MDDVYIPAPVVPQSEPSVAILDQEVEHQQLPAQVTEPLQQPNSPPKSPTPNTTQSSSSQPKRVEEESALDAPHKEKPSSSEALPPTKKRKLNPEAPFDLIDFEPFIDFDEETDFTS